MVQRHGPDVGRVGALEVGSDGKAGYRPFPFHYRLGFHRGHVVDPGRSLELTQETGVGLDIDGPILFPVPEDLPFLARPLSPEEKARASAVAKTYGLPEMEASLPVSVIGTGPDLNAATDNGLQRAAKLFDMSVPEVKNRATITGAIEIGRHPGVVQVTFRVPTDRLEKAGLLQFAIDQYGMP